MTSYTRNADGSYTFNTAISAKDLYAAVSGLDMTQLATDAGASSPAGGSSGGSTGGSTGGTTTPTPPSVTTPGFKGIFAFNNMTNPSLFNDSPNVAGVVITRYWAELNPAPGVYKFEIIDNDIQAWIAQGKLFILRVSVSGWKNWQPAQDSGHGTPLWVRNQIKTVTDDDGSVKPQYWASAFLTALQTFVQALAAKYDGHPNLLCVEIGVGDGGETKPDSEHNSDVLSKWQTIGYSDQVWWDTIQKIVGFYTATFKTTALALMPDASFIGGTKGFSESQVVKLAMDNNIWLQENGLIANYSLPGSFSILPKNYPLILEQRNDTATSGDSLQADLQTAYNFGARAILVFSSDLANSKNQPVLASFATKVVK